MVQFVTKCTKAVSHTGINNHANRRNYCIDKKFGELGDQANIQSMATLILNFDIQPAVTTANTGTLLYYNKGNHISVPNQSKHKCT
jgi:hypothetical protein